MNKYLIGYQEIFDCSVEVHAETPEQALELAKQHVDEAVNSYSTGDAYKEIWTDAAVDLIEEDD